MFFVSIETKHWNTKVYKKIYVLKNRNIDFSKRTPAGEARLDFIEHDEQVVPLIEDNYGDALNVNIAKILKAINNNVSGASKFDGYELVGLMIRPVSIK